MRTITIHYHAEGDSWWADSPDIEGFTAAAASFDELRPLVRQGVAFALEGEAVDLRELTADERPIIAHIAKGRPLFTTKIGGSKDPEPGGTLPSSVRGVLRTVGA